MEKDQKKTLYKMGLPIILGTILLIGVSYAWLTLTLNGTKANVLKAGTLSLTLTDDATEGINLASTVPMLDEVGVTTSPYSFTLTNNGDIDSEYTIYLDDVALDAGETRLADTVIKYNLVKDSTSLATALLSTTGSSPNRVLDSGTIKPGKTYSYDLRLWIDQDATMEISGQVFKGKIRVEASQTGPQEVTPESCFIFNSSTGTITGYSSSCTKDVVIPTTIGGVQVTTIGNTAFMNKYLKSVILPEGLISIGLKAFQDNKLTKVSLPSTLTSTGPGAFRHNQLTEVVFLEGLTTINGNAFDHNQLTYIELPNTLITIGSEAFFYNQLKTLEIPNSVETIGNNAFSTNQLTSVTIPDNVTSIGDYAFRANQLTSVILQGKSSSNDFTTYGSNIWGWSSGYSDANITWNG